METTNLNDKEVRAFAQKIGKGIKTESDLADFTKMMRKVVIETAFDVEMDDHLGYEKHAVDGNSSGNSRNGRSRKTLKGNHGELELEVPRDRAGTFEPQIVKKSQTRLTEMDDQVLFLYAKGMSTRDICATFKELYDADVSPSLVSNVFNDVCPC